MTHTTDEVTVGGGDAALAGSKDAHVTAKARTTGRRGNDRTGVNKRSDVALLDAIAVDLHGTGNDDTTNTVGNLLAVLLVGMVFIAIGLFVSSLTENQLAAAIGTIAIILGFLGIGLINSILPSGYWLRYIFDCISIFSRFQSYTNGYFDFASLLYYLSVCAAFLYFTVRVYDRRRYHG